MGEETTQFTIGIDASCSDGICGKVIRVVIDPVARSVTHLVVEPKHRRGLGKLVPLDLVDVVSDEVRIRCTAAEFEHLEAAEETQFLPGSGIPGYSEEQMLSWPFYSLGGGLAGDVGMAGAPQAIIYDAVPLGEVTVRRGEQVHATDGDIGRVQGLVVDPRNHHVTHVILQEGHLWGRRDVAIPIGAVATVHQGIRLNITKQQVQDLPHVEIDHLTE